MLKHYTLMKNKVPVIIVATLLSLLIAISIVVLIILKKNDDVGGDSSQNGSADSGERNEVVIDFELRQLVEKAEELVNKDLADALRQGDVQIDFMSALRKDLKEADKELSNGDVDEARKRYADVVSTAETRLDALEFAESARKLNDSAYAELEKHEYLKTAFENTYDETVSMYNQGLQDMEAGKFEESIRRFKTVIKILEELKEQAVQQVKAKLEAAESALSKFDPATARASFERVLEIDSSNSAAQKGLSKAVALEVIVNEMESISTLRKAGKNEAALAQINDLIAKNPGNSFLLDERKGIEADLAEDKREAIIKRAGVAEAEGDLTAAIAALKEANDIRSDNKTTKRLNQLKAKKKEKQMETLLETGYNSLKAGNYNAARTAYEAAIALDPKSKEAQAGIKKTSSLYLANIRYNKSIESAANYLIEGRVPLATKFFNEAIKSRPSTISFKQKDEEERIRTELAAQREPINVRIISDGKTYVSLIGVFAPERFKEKEIKLYPDIYTLKGTRSKYLPVETEVKVSKSLNPEGIEIICTEKL